MQSLKDLSFFSVLTSVHFAAKKCNKLHLMGVGGATVRSF